jgi:hypothetical protein
MDVQLADDRRNGAGSAEALDDLVAANLIGVHARPVERLPHDDDVRVLYFGDTSNGPELPESPHQSLSIDPADRCNGAVDVMSVCPWADCRPPRYFPNTVTGRNSTSTLVPLQCCRRLATASYGAARSLQPSRGSDTVRLGRSRAKSHRFAGQRRAASWLRSCRRVDERPWTPSFQRFIPPAIPGSGPLGP